MDVLNAAAAMRNSYYILQSATFKSPRIFFNNHHLPGFSVSSNSSGRSKQYHLLSVGCKLKTSKDMQNKQTPKKIILPDAAPSISEENERKSFEVGKAGRNSVAGFFRRAPGRILAFLSNLPFAIGQMFTIAVLMALGTVIDQGETPDFYFQKYPEENPAFGFFTWRWVLTLGFDHMYSSPVFLGMLALLAMSLMACTYTTQIPLVRVARRWSFLHSADAIRKQEFSDSLPQASIQDLGVILMGAGYEVSNFAVPNGILLVGTIIYSFSDLFTSTFCPILGLKSLEVDNLSMKKSISGIGVFMKGPSLYAFKGLAGRFAPIGVHLAMLLIMGGATLSATGSFHGSVTVPQGLNFVVGDVLAPSGFLSTPTPAFNNEVHVNKFYMDYYSSGEVAQFHTDLSLFDLDGKEVMRKTISVNDPLRYGGITIYQTDWSISALQILKDGEGPFNLAVAPLKLNGDKKLFGTFLPVGDIDSPNVKGISMLARDLQSVVLYDQEGKFAGVRRPGSKLPIEVDGIKIVIEEAIGSSGLDLKTDPGVPIVYVGFGALMLTTSISYLSHSQIWALQDGTTLVIGGKTNRAKLEFPEEMNRMLDRVPEIVSSGESPSSSVNQPKTTDSSLPQQSESITSDF